MGNDPGRSLSRHEFDAVIRRATELAQSDPDIGESALPEAEVFRIARDVGLADAHVRRALAEVRGGARQEAPGGFLDRIFGPTTVHASRIVPGKPKALARSLDDFFVASQLLEPVRRGKELLQYRPAVDWASKLAQAASFSSKKYYVASAKWVDVRLEVVDEEHTMVALAVDPGTRAEQVVGAAVGGGMPGIGLGVGATLLLTPALPLALAVAGAVVAGGGLAAGITAAVGRAHRQKLLEVRAEMEGILDRLETGESLEPPPPSWRRWVKRQFHGVARDMGRGGRAEGLDDLGDESAG